MVDVVTVTEVTAPAVPTLNLNVPAALATAVVSSSTNPCEAIEWVWANWLTLICEVPATAVLSTVADNNETPAVVWVTETELELKFDNVERLSAALFSPDSWTLSALNSALTVSSFACFVCKRRMGRASSSANWAAGSVNP